MTKLVSALVLCAFFTISGAQAEHTRVTHPSALSVELLGRGLLYSVNFDQVMNDELAAGVGFGTVGTSGIGSDTLTMIPVYVNYYFTQDQGSLYGTGGATIAAGDITNNSESSVGSVKLNNVIPTFGAGYENRGDNGFLFRVTAYGLIGAKFAPWIGFNLGYAF